MSLDLSSYKVASLETSSATKFNNMVQAVQDFVNALPIANLASYPSDATKYLRGDGTWAGTWSSYSPSWTASGTAVSLGNGTITGKYIQIGKLVVYEIILSMGSTTTYGTGNYSLSLPVTAAVTVLPAGTVYALDSSASQVYTGTAAIATSTTVFGLTTAQPSLTFGQLVPFTWAQSDNFQVLGAYEAA